MSGRSLKNRLRGLKNTWLLNPVFTSVFDRVQPRLSLGQRGELAAERFLLRLGHIVVGKSYSDGYGEIDIVTVDDRTIVFVEVKTRTSDWQGQPLEAVDEKKQRRITRTAKTYLNRYDLSECSSRFDVIGVEWPNQRKTPEICHVVNAFDATE